MDLPATCAHCNLPISAGERIIGQIDGRELHFCCPGCRGAHALITGTGLDSFYAKRAWDEPGMPQGAFETAYTDEYLDTFVRDTDGGREISFIVAGIRCAACIWLIESFLGKVSGIDTATVNYGTHRGRVRFDPARTSPLHIFQAISGLGYLPKPFTQDAARLLQEEESRSLLIRFGTASFLSMQLMGYSIALYGGYFSGMDPGTRQLMHSFAALVATPVVFFSGAPFLQGARRSLINKAPSMDLLITLGVLTAYVYSLGAVFAGKEVFFETAAMIVTLILLGRIFESNARKKAYSGIDRLFSLAPDTARLLLDGDTVTVTSAQLRVGDVILVGPGDRLPVDGMLLEGQTEVDESVLTGEAEPVLRKSNDTLLAGSLNVSTAVRVRVEQTAADSFIARIAGMVEEAQNRKAPVQGVADRVAGMFIPAVIAMALGTTLYWWLHGQEHVSALLNGIAVLVVACPCALGLATPTAILVATSVSADRGILFRGGDTMETASRLTVAGFDKTGTLTEPFPRVVSIHAVDGREPELLALAARIESGSGHPLALGIQAKAREEGIRAVGEGGTIVPGKGVRLETDEGILLAGNRSFMAENTISISADVRPTEKTEVHVAAAGKYRGCIRLESRLRPGAAEAVRDISGLGMETYLLTGDHVLSAENVADKTGINHVFAGMTPVEKAGWVEAQEKKGRQVLMVGDGVNDAPALSAASVGCAMSGGTDVALEISDLILMHGDLARLPEAIVLARKTLSIIRQNLFWAFSYNLVAIPLAATGYLAPVYAAAAMAVSSLCVVGNSLRLRAFNPGKAVLAGSMKKHQRK